MPPVRLSHIRWTMVIAVLLLVGWAAVRPRRRLCSAGTRANSLANAGVRSEARVLRSPSPVRAPL